MTRVGRGHRHPGDTDLVLMSKSPGARAFRAFPRGALTGQGGAGGTAMRRPTHGGVVYTLAGANTTVSHGERPGDGAVES